MKLNFTFKPMYYFLLLVWPFWRICHFSHSKIASNYVTDISDRCKWYANYKLKLPVSVVYSKEVTFWQTDRHGKLRLPVPLFKSGHCLTDRHGKLRLPVSAVYSIGQTDRHGKHIQKEVMFRQTDWQTYMAIWNFLFQSCFSGLFKSSHVLTDRHSKLRLPVSAVYSKRVYVQTDRLTDRHGNLKLPVSAVYS